MAVAIFDYTAWAARYPALAADLDTQQLMDLVFTVGAYDVVAMAFLSFGVQVDEDLAAFVASRKRHSPE